jgi:hypothetical protein
MLRLSLPSNTLSNPGESTQPSTFFVLMRHQNNATTHLYPNVRTCIRRTWAEEGAQGFYRGLGTNVVRVLPGTCVTFVVYENIAHLLRTRARRRELEMGSGNA